MDVNTGKPYPSEMGKEEFKRIKSQCAPITKRQHDHMRPLKNGKRKNYMRNQPCVCGSKKKFKKCCWNKYE